MRGDNFRARDEGRQVGRVRVVHGCRHGHNNDVGLAQARGIGRAGEMHGGLKSLPTHLLGRIETLTVGCDFAGAEVKADGAKLLAKFYGKRQSHIPKSYNADRLKGHARFAFYIDGA